MLVIGLSGTGIWTLQIGLVSKRVLVVLGELALGLVVVAIKLLAH